MILVLGAGRSGTSAIAGFLHESGISMGRSFHLPDEFNKNGYWEDLEVQDLDCKYVVLGLHEHEIEEPHRLWKEQFNKLVSERVEPYGIKEPSMLDHEDLFKYYLSLKPDIIWCDREREDNIASLMRFKGHTYKEAEEIYDSRTAIIKKHYRWWRDLRLDCYDNNKFKKLKKWLKKKNYPLSQG